MIVLDTDCLTLLQRKRGTGYLDLVKNLSRFPTNEISTTIVSFDEQVRGWMSMVAKARTTEALIYAYDDLESFLTAFPAIF